jgi:sulfite exporter TauE/SafE
VFLVGLLGSVHCAGMCGGIVGALSLAPARLRPGTPVIALRAAETPPPATRTLAYNAGRIASYAAAGALAGGLAGGAARWSALPLLQGAAYVAANLLLVALGLWLMDAWHGVARIEAVGRRLWQHVAPLLRRVGPPDTGGRMFVAGALWGWLPCAMVYSVLVTAMLSGSASQGAAVMLAFGLGTLPMMMALGLAGARLRKWLRLKALRLACGATVLGFGLLGLARAAGGLPASWLAGLCIAPGMAP